MTSPRRHLAFALIIVLAHSAIGQPADLPLSTLSVSIGAAHYRFIDEAYAHQPIMFRGTACRPQLTYERFKRNHLVFVHASGSSAHSRSDARHLPDPDLIHVYLAATYARLVHSMRFMNTTGRLYAGVQLASSNYGVENIDDHDELSLSVYHAFNVFVHQRMTISPRNQLALSVSFPFAGLVKRQSYDGGINQEFEEQYREGIIHLFTDDTRFSGISPMALPQLMVDLVRSLGPGTHLIVTYQFNYLRDTSIAPVRLYSNTLLTGLRFKLNRQQ